MDTTTKTPASTVTVDRRMLEGLVAQLMATHDLLGQLAGSTDIPVTGFFDPWFHAADEWLGITWEDEDQPANAAFHRLVSAAHELTAEMLDAVVADPYAVLVSDRTSRRELHNRARDYRRFSDASAAEADALERRSSAT